MRIAILPIEVDEFKQLASSTKIAYLLSYLSYIYPDDIIYPACTVEFVINTKPDIVCIYSDYNHLFHKLSKAVSIIKEKLNIPILLAGNYITYLPKTLPQNIDAGIVGEGEETLKELIETFKEDNAFAENKLAAIAGIVFHPKDPKEQKIITRKRQLVQNLDFLPLSRSFFYDMPGNWLPIVLTGRGPAAKSFNDPASDEPVRLHSPERLLNEFVDIVTFLPNRRDIIIADELFLHDVNRLKTFAEIVVESDLTKYFSFEITARPEQLNPEIFYLLKYVFKINLLNINFPYLSPKTQKDLKEPIIDRNVQKGIFDEAYKYNIKINLSFYIGAPNETREEISQNYWFIRQFTTRVDNNVEFRPQVLIAQPGSEAWARAVNKRIVNENIKEWDIFDPNDLKQETPVLNPLFALGEFPKIIKEFKILNDKKKTSTPMSEKMDKLLDKMLEIGQKTIDEFVSSYKKLGKEMGEVNSFSKLNSLFGFMSPLPEHIELSVIDAVEQIVKNNDLRSLLKINEPITKIIAKFNEHNLNNNLNELINTKNITGLAMPDVLEQIIRHEEVESILEITDPILGDLKKILLYDKYEIDSIRPKVFDIPKLKLNTDKQYDCVVLLFTLDIVRNIDRVLKYSNQVLKKDGVLIVSFFNAESIFVLNQLTINANINDLFNDYKKSNFYTSPSMNKLLKKNKFITKKIVPLIYPDKKHIHYLQRYLSTVLTSSFKNIEDFMIFSYTFVCKKSEE